jgi:hypothetical protein
MKMIRKGLVTQGHTTAEKEGKKSRLARKELRWIERPLGRLGPAVTKQAQLVVALHMTTRDQLQFHLLRTR